MIPQSALKIELHRRGKVQTFEIHAERALVGSGSHCDLRLLPDEAAIEQLALEIRDETVHAEALAFQPPCQLNGAPFFGGTVTPDGLIELGGGAALRVELTTASTIRARPKSSSQTSPAVQGLGLVAVAAGLYFALQEPAPPATAAAQMIEPPALPSFDSTCPHSEAAPATSEAAQAAVDAENKRERSPFVASDGLKAMELYARAAGCLRVVGDEAGAKAAEQAHNTLRARLADELHVRHVRIERLLAQAKYATVPLEVRNVQELVADPAHPYAAWLSRVEREAILRVNSNGK